MKITLLANLKSPFLTFLFLIGSIVLTAQNLEISGTLTDSTDASPLIGANIVIKGSNQGTASNIDGKYKISASKGDVLVFSYIGYLSKEITIQKAGVYNINLNPSITKLDDLIIIGYSSQKKTDKTGAVTMVKAEEINGGVLTDPIQGMQGKAAGVSITKKGGDPNEGFSVRIRGASGFSSNTQPLYVIDGIPGADPTIISPSDIESYNILKDAASTAIYGSRGANGVIIITTKKGSVSQSKLGNASYSNIEYSSQVSFERISKKLPVLSSSGIRDFANKLLLTAQVTHPNYTIDSVFLDGGANTDWQDVIYRRGISTTNNLSFSGGTKKNSYLASIGQANWEGVMRGTAKKRTTARLNVDHKALNDKLTINGNMMASFEQNDYENYGSWNKDDIIYQAISRNPTDPIYNADGSYYKASRVFNYENPISVIDQVTNNRDANKFLGGLKVDYELFKGFVAGANFGYISDINTTNYFRPADLYSSADNGSGKKQYNNNTQKLMEITAIYQKTIKKYHNINILGGYSWQESMYSGFYSQGGNAQSNFSGPDNLKILNDVKWGDIGSWKGKSNLIGYFARAQYNYNSKYYISASIRRDGSSKFGSNNKWGWFPTTAIGWNIDQEEFLKKLKNVNQLKLRASYGISGNQEIGEYRSIVVWEASGKAVNPETGQEVITFKPAWNANPNLKWEETSELNFGLDYGFFKNKVSGSLEIYKKTTTDLLGEYSVPVPPNLAQKTFANSGSLENNGIELFIQLYPVDKKNFDWKTSFTIAHNKTKILDLGKYFNELDGVRKEGYVSGRGMVGEEYYLTGIMVNEEVGAFYLPTYVTLKDGKFIYVSKTGGFTDVLSDAKRTVIGTAAPKLEIGWSNSLTLYKRWNVAFAFRSMIGNYVYNATAMFFDNPGNLPSLNALPEAVDWYNKGRISGSSIANIYVENASFVKLDFISVSYDVNISKYTNLISKLNLFVSANNLLTITGYSGIDPETKMNGLSFGIDQYNVYPKTRSFSAGLKVNF